MTIDIAAARALLERRNAAFAAADIEAFLELWADDCVVEGPAHHLVGKRELGATLTRGWAAMQPVHMGVHSISVNGDVIFYEWVFVAKLRHNGELLVGSGMTWHQVDESGRFAVCREYFDPPNTRRASVCALPAVAELLAEEA